MKVRWADIHELSGVTLGFSKMMDSDSQTLIENVKTQYRVLKVNDDIYFPVTINDSERGNSYVCSPYASYIEYSKKEIGWMIFSKVLRSALIFVINAFSSWFRYGKLDKNVHVNNFLLSTNPYPKWDGKEMPAVTAFLQDEYPDHALIFRSINDYEHPLLLDQFKKINYDLIVSRQIYLYDISEEEWLKRINNKKDTKLIRRRKLHYVDHEEMKPFLSQALALYSSLYLKKYTKLNPQFTLKYFKESYELGVIRFHGYVDETGLLKAFSGQVTIGNTITSPILGYDLTAPKKDGLYIHAAHLSLLRKFKSGLLLNKSAGAGKFKMLRGGKPSIEFSAVYSAHLPRKRRLRWKVLRYLMKKVGLAIMKKYKI